jgi:hypothetical protein
MDVTGSIQKGSGLHKAEGTSFRKASMNYNYRGDYNSFTPVEN